MNVLTMTAREILEADLADLRTVRDTFTQASAAFDALIRRKEHPDSQAHGHGQAMEHGLMETRVMAAAMSALVALVEHEKAMKLAGLGSAIDRLTEPPKGERQ